MSLQPNVVGHNNMSITIALRVMVMLLLFSSCSGRKKEMGAAITERDSLPVMDTKGVTTLISDFFALSVSMPNASSKYFTAVS